MNIIVQTKLFYFLIFFCLSFLIPYIIRLITNRSGTLLIDYPVYLNNLHTVGNEDILYSIKPRNYNYSISLWFWINPQPSNTNYAYQKYSNILTFDKKPAVQYNGLSHTLRVIFDNHDNTETIYSTNDVLYQKWNNLVINYSGGYVDSFLNNKLIGSKLHITPYFNYNFINIGEQNGIHGGISNVVYFDKPLNLIDIGINYNTYKNMKEPYI
jgi:hypothetical protein